MISQINPFLLCCQRCLCFYEGASSLSESLFLGLRQQPLGNYVEDGDERTSVKVKVCTAEMELASWPLLPQGLQTHSLRAVWIVTRA